MEEGSTLILNYHLVSSATEAGNPFSITPSALNEQLQLLQALNIPVCPVQSLLNKPASGRFSVALTFDDCYHSDYNTVFPLLKKFGYRATFFPIIERMDEPGHLTWQQLQHLSQYGFSIGSHGLSHTPFSRLATWQLKDELATSKKILEEKTGVRVTCFAVPYGWYNSKVVLAVKDAGYSCLMGTGLKVNKHNPNAFLFHRWNITTQLNIKAFEKILLSKGNLSTALKISGNLKHYTKKILGPELSDRLYKFF